MSHMTNLQIAQVKKGDFMSVYKDEQRGTWYCMFRYQDWTGKQKQKCKRGFKTKREAKEYEEQFIHTTEADMNIVASP